MPAGVLIGNHRLAFQYFDFRRTHRPVLPGCFRESIALFFRLSFLTEFTNLLAQNCRIVPGKTEVLISRMLPQSLKK